MNLKIICLILLSPVIFFTIYYFESVNFLKIIPVLFSLFATLFFLFAHLNKKRLILTYTKKFYKKKLTDFEIEYISKGDIYWVYVTTINATIQFILIFENSVLWLFYSSFGWYIFFFFALIVQVFYGKIKEKMIGKISQ